MEESKLKTEDPVETNNANSGSISNNDISIPGFTSNNVEAPTEAANENVIVTENDVSTNNNQTNNDPNNSGIISNDAIQI